MERKESILEKTAQALDLPPDVAGLPRIELLGDRELRVEYHKGILAYGTEEIHISGGKLIIRVLGSNLELRSMNASELLVTGHIHAVELT
ncbi:MAG: YabP/YqfC family sporulation protein [Oscillospiraceae bacterium]